MFIIPGFPQTNALASLKNIHVGSISPGDQGTKEECKRFSSLLEAELNKSGFRTVAQDADAILTGNLDIMRMTDGSINRTVKNYWVKVALGVKTEDSQPMWQEDSHAPLPPWLLPPKDDKLERRAQDLARKLKKAVASAKK